MIKTRSIFAGLIAILLMCCNNAPQNEKPPVQLITLDPGHFHAALVQKVMYPDVDSNVFVYAPEGNDLKLHLGRINGYNNSKENPTHWKEHTFSDSNFFEKMLAEKKGNVVVIAGNNQKKTEYILRSLQNGYNVLADKPMAISTGGFEQLKQAFEAAARHNLLLYDIMTERFEITSVLQREIAMIPEIFGSLQQGSLNNPAIDKEGIHYFYKYISGNVVTRPPWFFDPAQQGDGIADVMTHLVDLAQWESFPEQAIDYHKDIEVDSARHWTTDLRLDEFKEITHLDSFPGFLNNNITGTLLHVYSNGEIRYRLRGVYVRTSVVWQYKAPEGSGDAYHSIMKGSRCNLIILQGKEENYKPVLYIESVGNDTAFEPVLMEKIKMLQSKYPGIELKKTNADAVAAGHGHNRWQVLVPEKYKEGHEEHFARVTRNFLSYLKNKNMPSWEVPGMLAKYYTTTKALELAKRNE